MRLWEIVFWTGETRIEFARTRMEIRRKYVGVFKINEVIIH